MKGDQKMNNHFGVGILLGFLVGGIMMLIIVAIPAIDDNINIKKHAVENCGAYYHPQTGKFTWKSCTKTRS